MNAAVGIRGGVRARLQRLVVLAFAGALLSTGANLFTTSQPARATSITVNTAIDPSPNAQGKFTDTNRCSLRAAIISAQNNSNAHDTDCATGLGNNILDSIHIDASLAGQTLTMNGREFEHLYGPTNPVEIIGPNTSSSGFTINGNNASRIFELGFAGFGTPDFRGIVKMANLTIKGGNGQHKGSAYAAAEGDGGAMHLGDGTQLTLDNVVLRDNTVTQSSRGAAIYAIASTITNNGGAYINNKASGNGGTGSGGGRGGAIFLESTPSTLNGYAMLAESNTAAYAGGVVATNPGLSNPLIHLERSLVKTNSAKIGGVFYVDSSVAGKVVELHDSTVTGNSAATSGGVFFSQATRQNFEFLRDTFVGNTGTGGLFRGGGGTAANSIINSSGCENTGGGDGFTSIRNLGDGCAQLGTMGPVTGLSPSLAQNGGPLVQQTFALSGTSNAIDNGAQSHCGLLDARSVTRGTNIGTLNSPQPGDCDIGAYEYAPAVVNFVTGTSSVLESQASVIQVRLKIPDGIPLSAPVTVNVTRAPSSTARAAIDYTVPAATVIFPAGSADNTIKNYAVSTINDNVAEANGEFVKFTLGGTGVAVAEPKDHTLTIQDDDQAGFIKNDGGNGTTVSEATATTATDTLTISLRSQPDFVPYDDPSGRPANVVAHIQPDRDCTVTQGGITASFGNPIDVTIQNANWQTGHTLTVRAVNDLYDEDLRNETTPHTCTITFTFTSPDIVYNATTDSYAVTVNDNDTAGVTVAQSGGTTNLVEGGATDTYTLVLESQPDPGKPLPSTARGPVNVVATPNAQCNVGSGNGVARSFPFTGANWNTPQTVTVTANDDLTVELDHTCVITNTISSQDPIYNDIDDLPVFAKTPASVTAAIKDFEPPTILNDPPNVVISTVPGGVTVDEATSSTADTFSVVLFRQPLNANVTVTLTSSADPRNPGPGSQLLLQDSDATTPAAPASSLTLTFTPANWNTAQIVRTFAVNDDFDETDPHAASIAATMASTAVGFNNATFRKFVIDGAETLNIGTVPVTIVDNDVSSIVVTESGTTNVTEGGATDTYSFRLGTHPYADVTVTVDPEDQCDIGFGTGVAHTYAIPHADWNSPLNVTVTAVNDRLVEAPKTCAIAHAATSTGDALYNLTGPTVTANVTDNDPPRALITTGGVLHVDEAVPLGGALYSVVLQSQPDADVSVSATVSDGQTLVGTGGTPGTTVTLAFTNANWDQPQTVSVFPVDDLLDEPDPHPGLIAHAITSTATRFATAPEIHVNEVAGATVTAQIADNDIPPAITSANAATFVVGTAGSFTVVTTGFPVPTTSSTGALPDGVTFTPDTEGGGTLAGTPAAATGGAYPITFAATNGVSPDATQSFTLTVNQPPEITSTDATTFVVGTPGSFAVTTTGFPTATVTQTGSLPAGVTLSPTGALAGTPAAGTGGTYPINITATNGVSPDATQAFTLTVNQAPAITSANAATFTVGTPGSFTVTSTGFPLPTASSTGALPDGVTFTPDATGGGTLAGTPGPGTGGAYPITFAATNGVSPDASQAFTLAVSQPPEIISTDATTFVVGTPGSFAVTTTGFPAPTVSTSSTLPTGVTLSPTGALAGTPAAGTGGTYPINITATNGVSPDATQSFTLTVNQAPAITSATGATFVVGTPGSFTVTSTGFPLPTTSSTGALPDGVTFTPDATGGGTLAGTPGPGTGGAYPITFAATNGVSPDASQAFTLAVSQPPEITSTDATTFVVGTPGSFAVTTTGFPTVSTSSTLPTGVTLSPTGALAGTPAAGTGGTYPINITATNGVSPDATQSFTLTVNQAPAITSATGATFVVGTPGSFTVTSTGFPLPTTSSTGALPDGVTFTPDATGGGTLAGTPGPGTGGIYNVAFTAANGVSPDATQPFTLTVNQAPAITSANAATFTVGTPGSFAVTTTGFPTATVTQTGSLPTGVTLSPTGALAGTPAAGTGGTYPINITATNGVSPDATQSFTLTVNQAPAITSANAATFTVGTPGSFTVTSTGFPLPTASSTGALPDGVTFTPDATGGGTLAGTPGPGTGGIYNVAFTAANGVSPDATQPFTLTVNQAPAITSANAATFTVGTPGSFAVTTTGFPTATVTQTGSLPTGVTLSPTGALAGTPAAGTGGTYPINITATNGVSPDATQPFTLTVNQAPAITSANAATFTVGTPGSFTVTSSGVPIATASSTGALPDGVTFTPDATGGGTLAGTPGPGTGGIYNVAFTAANGVSPDATQSFTLTVNQAPAITSANATTFTLGIANSFAVTTTGLPKPALSRTGVALPSGVTFVDNGDGTGTLAGTPAPGTIGSYAIGFDAANGVGPTVSQPFTLTVNQATAITSANATTFTVGQAGTTFVVTSAGLPTPTVSQSGALPAGITFTPNASGGGTLAGTPAAGTGGSYPIGFTATNGVSPPATQAFTLTVNQAPAITTQPTNQAAAPGSSVTFTAAASGFPAPTPQWQVSPNGSATFTAIPGATAPTLTFPVALADNGNRYQAVFTNVVSSATTNPVTLTTSIPTATAVSSAPNPSVVGQSVTFTATVTATGSQPTGSVTFRAGATALSGAIPLNGSGQATFPTSALTFGSHTITASYTPSAPSFLASQGNVSQTVKAFSDCTRTVTGSAGEVTAAAGESVCVTNATIASLAVNPGGGAFVSGSRITGNATVTSPKHFVLCGSTVTGSVGVAGATGLVQIGDWNNEDGLGCGANSVTVDIVVSGSTASTEISNNGVGRDLSLNNVTGRGPFPDDTAPELESNRIGRNLSCSGNSPAPTNDGTPNRVSGVRSGQCAAL